MQLKFHYYLSKFQSKKKTPRPPRTKKSNTLYTHTYAFGFIHDILILDRLLLSCNVFACILENATVNFFHQIKRLNGKISKSLSY